MSGHESLPITRPLRMQFLDLAVIFIRKEVKAIKPWGPSGRVFTWEDEGMKSQISSQMRDEDFPDDDWNMSAYRLFAGSHDSHEHSIEYFRIVDKRVRP